MTYMYHGWDPMMFRDRQNFGAVISAAGLIKPTGLAGGKGHITSGLSVRTECGIP